MERVETAELSVPFVPVTSAVHRAAALETTMLINGMNLPSIGLIRAKPIGDGARYTLIIYPPPGPGPLAGAEPATMIEIEVDREEVQRIDRVAPHLLARGWSGRADWAN